MTQKVRPHNQKHAIKSMAFALEFQDALTASDLEEFSLSEADAKLKQQLPFHTRQQAVVINVIGDEPTGISGTSSNRQAAELSGLVYAVVQKNGQPEWALNIQRNLVSVMCGDYNRWKATWETARRHLSVVAPSLLSKTTIGAIGLQYVDEFWSVGARDEFLLSDLFSIDSIYLPKHLLGTNGPCHSHMGFFDDSSTAIGCRRLHNINVTVTEQPRDLLIQILTSHKAILREPLSADVGSLLGDDGRIDAVFQDLHKKNKDIVGNMLNEEVKQMINFYGSKSAGEGK